MYVYYSPSNLTHSSVEKRGGGVSVSIHFLTLQVSHFPSGYMDIYDIDDIRPLYGSLFLKFLLQ